MTILVVEDEPKTGVFLQQGLSEAGFAVERVTDGTAALQRALATPYELLILDIMLPGLDGWQVLSQLRAAGQQTPVLFSAPATASRTGFAAWSWAPTIT